MEKICWIFCRVLPRAILVQNEYLARRKPTEGTVGIVQSIIQNQILQKFEKNVMIELARIRANVILHSMLFRSIGISLYLADGGIFVRHGYRRSRFVGLAGRSVHNHYPSLTLVLVIRGKYYVVPFADSVEIKSVKKSYDRSQLQLEYVNK